MVPVGSVDVLAAEVDVLELVDPEVLACKSTNSFCRAELKLDPLLLVELTAPVLDAEAAVEDGSNEALVLLVLLPAALLYRS